MGSKWQLTVWERASGKGGGGGKGDSEERQRGDVMGEQ